MSYPAGASNLTFYQAEPWHFRWIGRDRAAAFEASGLTLREWLWRQTFGRGREMDGGSRPITIGLPVPAPTELLGHAPRSGIAT